MMNAMMKEIIRSKAFLPAGEMEEPAATIYFGGGTPSLLSVDEIKKLLDTVHEYFTVSDKVEITLEANPDDISETKLAEWKRAGINRFSIGIQSFRQPDLEWMNRAHNADQALRSIQMVKEAGFNNYSVDLIYGTPTLTDDDWKKNVQTVIDHNVPHVSCYALTVEPGTALQKMISTNRRPGVDPDKQSTQFLLLMEWMAAAGYEHYEISNFARPGFRSQHNSSYWQGRSYIGIGPSAHSFNGYARRWNIANNSLYIRSLQKGTIPYEEEKLSDVQKLNEYIMTSLRTSDGIDLAFVAKTFGEAVKNKLQNNSGRYLNALKLHIVNNRLILTNEGKLFADGIAGDLFFEEKIKTSSLG